MMITWTNYWRRVEKEKREAQKQDPPDTGPKDGKTKSMNRYRHCLKGVKIFSSWLVGCYNAIEKVLVVVPQYYSTVDCQELSIRLALRRNVAFYASFTAFTLVSAPRNCSDRSLSPLSTIVLRDVGFKSIFQKVGSPQLWAFRDNTKLWNEPAVFPDQYDL